ncbi:MAG: hypothetical protein ACM31C_23510 [Acidobacteriota bacterium]
MTKLALVWVIVVACAAPLKTSQAPAPQQPMPAAGGPRGEIEQLSNQIEAQRAQMALPEPPAAPQMATTPNATPMGQVPSSHDEACHHGTSQTCTDSCDLSDQICGNAQKICDLAQQLQGDAWAAGKCERGKQTCDAAHASCCACQQ